MCCALQAWFGWSATEQALRLPRPLPAPPPAPLVAPGTVVAGDLPAIGPVAS